MTSVSAPPRARIDTARHSDPQRVALGQHPRNTPCTYIDSCGRLYISAACALSENGQPLRIYGRIDCPAAQRATQAGGGDAANRILFDCDAAAGAAGYRPCAVCLPQEYTHWKAQR